MSIKIKTAVGAFLLTTICSGLGASAADIPLVNAGFEAPVVTTEPVPGAGPFNFDVPDGWDLYDPNNLIPTNASLQTPFTGVWAPSDSYFPTVPEGNQISSIFLVPPGAGEVGFTQNTGVVILPATRYATRYTFSAAVLNTPGGPFTGFPGYRLELLAGNNVIASDNNSLTIPEGGVRRARVSYVSPIGDTNAGQDLSIRLVNLNLNNNSGVNNGNGIEVNFDDVRLEETPVPDNGVMPWQLSVFMMFSIIYKPIRVNLFKFLK